MIFSLIFSYFLIASHTHYEDCLKMYFCFCGGHFKQISRLGVVHHEYDFKKLWFSKQKRRFTEANMVDEHKNSHAQL